jgi:tetratricopeptide (TPR) repeat protein
MKDSQGEYKEAITFYLKSLEIYKKTLPSNHPDLAASYNNIGVLYYSMDEYSKALSSYEIALEIRQQSLPANHPDLAISCFNIGLLCEKMGEYPKARSFYERAVQRWNRYRLPAGPPYLLMHFFHTNVYKTSTGPL